jgi:acylphosphatase
MPTVRVIVRGKVQGVGFRDYTQMQALALKLDGWVRNRRDGTVEAMLSGEKAVIERMLIALRVGPPHSAVINVRSEPEDGTAVEPGFRVLPTE